MLFCLRDRRIGGETLAPGLDQCTLRPSRATNSTRPRPEIFVGVLYLCVRPVAASGDGPLSSRKIWRPNVVSAERRVWGAAELRA